MNKCVWIGVCDLKKIIDRRFSNCYKKGEGAYWIWQAGCNGGAQYFSNVLSDSQTLVFILLLSHGILMWEIQSRLGLFTKNRIDLYNFRKTVKRCFEES